MAVIIAVTLMTASAGGAGGSGTAGQAGWADEGSGPSGVSKLFAIALRRVNLALARPPVQPIKKTFVSQAARTIHSHLAAALLDIDCVKKQRQRASPDELLLLTPYLSSSTMRLRSFGNRSQHRRAAALHLSLPT